jgi:hypothetical protein
MARWLLLPVLALALIGCGRLGYDPVASVRDGDIEDSAVVDDGQADAVASVAGWWDCNWLSRQPISIISEGTAVTAPYAMSVTFDHAGLVAAGSSKMGGDDVRIIHFKNSVWTEIDRVLDPASSWNATDTKVWFNLADDLPAIGTTSLSYFLYFGSPLATIPPSDANTVFHYADLFDRADSGDVGAGWILRDGNTGFAGNIDLLNGALYFESVNQADNRPIADHTFPTIGTELVWRVGFNWQRTGVENTYRLHLQMGNSGAMEAVPSTAIFSQVGVGPSLVWVSPDQGAAAHETLGYEVAQAFTEMSVISGRADIEVIAYIGGGAYDVFVDGALFVEGAPFSTAQSQLDQIRLMPFDIGHDSFASRDFDYVIVRKHVSPEPRAKPAVLQASNCP